MNQISLKSLISNIQSNELEPIGDEPTKKLKSLSSRSVGQPAKSPQVWESEEAPYVGDYEEC